jgi:type VI secretion system VasD/TssJ family lipoprotein
MRKQNSKLLMFSAYFWMIMSLVGCGAFTFLGFGTASVNLQPSETMNVDDNGNPLPTVVRIYQLKSKYKMEKADFRSLWKNLAGKKRGYNLSWEKTRNRD